MHMHQEIINIAWHFENQYVYQKSEAVAGFSRGSLKKSSSPSREASSSLLVYKSLSSCERYISVHFTLMPEILNFEV